MKTSDNLKTSDGVPKSILVHAIRRIILFIT